MIEQSTQKVNIVLKNLNVVVGNFTNTASNVTGYLSGIIAQKQNAD